MVICIILSVLTGVTIVLSRTVNAKLSEYIGPYGSTLMNYVTGILGSFLLMIIMGSAFPLRIKGISVSSFYIYLGGFLGVISIFINNKITSKMPSFELTLLILVGQLVSGILLDYFIMNIFSPGKLVGSIFVALGLFYSVKGDKKETLLKA